MANFFKINDEKIIGYKYLTNADLGRSDKSHQTHIGLFDDTFTYLPNNIDINDALFIYNNTCTPVFMSFGRIHRKNGDYNSPKIKSGGEGVISIVSIIKNTAKDNPNILEWYMFWFGLKSEQPVFFLFNNQSQTYTDIVDMGIGLKIDVKNRLIGTDPSFNKIMLYLENIVNTSGENIIRELEIASQTGFAPKDIKLRTFDIKKVKENFEKIGRKGEELVNSRLAMLKHSREIESYTWLNENDESGKPYDFTIQELSGNIIYLDVKSTSLGFDQQIIFSNQELDFISSLLFDYHVYRVYDVDKDEKHLRICKNYKTYATLLSSKIGLFIEDIKTIQAILQTSKIAINTTNVNYFTFDNEIILT